MHNMSDIIEQYLKQLLEEAQGDVVEIKRAHIAEKFDCVPSQLNYVIKQDLQMSTDTLSKVKEAAVVTFVFQKLKRIVNQHSLDI